MKTNNNERPNKQAKELYTTSAELTQKIVTSSLHKQIDRIFNPR